MEQLMLVFMVVCGSFGSYIEAEIARTGQDLTRTCNSESWMADGTFVHFLDTAEYYQVSGEAQRYFENHLSVNREYYYGVIDLLGGASHMEQVTPDIIFEDLED